MSRKQTPIPEIDWPQPQTGGSYRRDPITGALTLIDEADRPAAEHQVVPDNTQQAEG